MAGNILVLGAGRSSSVLIQYLLRQSEKYNTRITVADVQLDLAQQKTNHHPNADAIAFSIEDANASEIIARHDIVISLLPPTLHGKAAQYCLQQQKHLLTASYVNDEMRGLHEEAVRKDILIMGEMGLDPGIDHMSAMQIIHRLKKEGKQIISFKSSTGGLVAPESDDNPWNYKITWNPRNVVLAGQGLAQYKEGGHLKYLPYHRLFTQTEKIKLPKWGKFEAYANRDSLSYERLYELDGIDTLVRATLRREGYCEAWNILVQLGLTDDTVTIKNADSLTYRDWLASYLPESKEKNIEKRLASFFKLKASSHILTKLKWMGLFSKEFIPFKQTTAARILQHLMEQKWVMKKNDRDMIVMVHDFIYKGKFRKQHLRSSLVVLGDNNIETAMAKTVGLPLGILAMMLVRNECTLRGVHIPVMPEVYEPVLKELEEYGISFHEQVMN